MHVYKYGRNGDAGIGVGAKAIAPIVSYSFGVKGMIFCILLRDFMEILCKSLWLGLFAGVSLDGEVMTTRGYCNEMYYGKRLSVKDILTSTTRSNDNGVTWKQNGKARMLKKNRDYETLIQMLNDYCVDEHLDNNNYIPPAMNTPNHSFNAKQDDKYKPMNGKGVENGNNNRNKKRKKSGSAQKKEHKDYNHKRIDSSKYIKNGNKSKKKKKWSCHKCTFINKWNAKACEMCGTKREEEYPFEYREDQDEDNAPDDDDDDDVKEEVHDEEEYEEEYDEEQYEEIELNDDNVDNEQEQDLDVNDDNQGNKGNSEIWNNKVY